MNNKALIVIDFINDIVHPEGKVSQEIEPQVQKNEVIAHANKAIEHFRKQNLPVIFVKVGFSSAYIEQPKNSPIFGLADQYKALELGAWGTEYHKDLDVLTSDYSVVKNRINPFYNTSLATVLSANNIDEVFMCGVSTNWAVHSAVMEAHDRDFKVNVIEDACAAANETNHNASIETLSRVASIIKTTDL